MPTTQVGQPGFALFGWGHWLALCAVVMTGVGTGWLWRRLARRGNATPLLCGLSWSLGATLAVAWLAGPVVQALRGEWSLQESLPLHLCDLGTFASVVLVWFAPWRGRRAARVAAAGPVPSAWYRVGWYQLLFELAYFWSVGGSVQALLTPDVPAPFPDVLTVRFFVTHGGTLALVLMLLIGPGLRPARGAVWRAWVVTVGLALVVLLLNGLLGANYMYLCGPPREASLYDWFGPWPWSLLSLVAVGTGMFLLLYLPFYWGRVRSR